MKKARELDPLSTRINADLEIAYLAARSYDEAIAQEQKTMELNPKAGGPFWIRGIAYQQKKMYSEAIKDFRHTLEIYPGIQIICRTLYKGYIADTLLHRYLVVEA